MGLKTSTGQAKWIQLTRGMFVLTDNGVKNEYPALEATLVSLGFRDAEFEGKKKREVVCTFRDGGELYRLSLDSDGGYGRQLLLKLMNADLSQPLELTPTYSDEGGKKSSGMFVSQHGSQLKQRFNKDTLPQPKTTEFGGKTLYDFSEQKAFIENYAAQHIIPALLANAAHTSSHDRTSQGESHVNENQDGESGSTGEDGNTPF